MTGLPLHERIRRHVERRILSGNWQPGARIPLEREFMQQFDCSRMTVNKALVALVAAGLVERRRRAGSFVARPRLHSALLAIPDLESEVARRGGTYGYELLTRSQRSRRRTVSPGEQLSGARQLLLLTCRHFADGRVLALEQRTISLSAVPEARDADFNAVSPGTWLLRHVPWTEAEHRIFALNADARQARLLRIESGGACLAVERRTWRGGDEVTHVCQVFPAGRYDLVAHFGAGASAA